MLGDHAPSFITGLSNDAGISQSEIDIAYRTVPFVIWANFDMNLPENMEYASMVDLMPLVLRASGLPLSPYYEKILALHEIIPLRLYNGTYRDSKGIVGTYSADNEYHSLLSEYYYMEYNGLNRKADYLKELFETPCP